MHIPLFLTIFRLFSSVTLLPIFFMFVPWQTSLLGAASLGLFLVILNLTDFFDGRLARSFGQVTMLGTLLDPLADKIMMMVSLSALLQAGLCPLPLFIIMMGRELVVLSLREIARAYAFSVPVDRIGKYKTASQMFFVLTAVMWQAVLVPAVGSLGTWMMVVFLCAAVLFAIVSAVRYSGKFIDGMRRVRAQEGE